MIPLPATRSCSMLLAYILLRYRAYPPACLHRMQAQRRVDQLKAVIAENSDTRLRQLQAYWQTERRMDVVDGVDMTRVDQSFTSWSSISGGPHMDRQERGESPFKRSRESKSAKSSLLLSSSDEDTDATRDLTNQFSTALMDRISVSSSPRTPPRKKSTETSDQASTLSLEAADPAPDGAEARLVEEYIGRCTKEEVQRALSDAQGHGGRARKKLNLLTKGRTPQSPELERGRSPPPKLSWAATSSSGSSRTLQQAEEEPKLQPRRRPPSNLQPEPEPEPRSAVQEGIPVTSAVR